MAERCRCGHEGVTVLKEEVVKPLENSSKGCIYSCVRAKWDGTSSGYFGVNLKVTGKVFTLVLRMFS